MRLALPVRLAPLVGRFESAADAIRSPLLLAVRLVWGWGFVQAGAGKLGDLGRTTAFFDSLGIPAPGVNAAMAAATECIGGVLLIAGLGSRLVAVPLVVTMLVAYATAHRDSLSSLDAFVVQAPFPFLSTALAVLAFGPGKFALDALVARPEATRPASA